jgi:hypothetical protein
MSILCHYTPLGAEGFKKVTEHAMNFGAWGSNLVQRTLVPALKVLPFNGPSPVQLTVSFPS